MFGSWGFNGLQLDIFNSSPTGDTCCFVDYGEWELKEIPLYRRVDVYPSGPFPTLIYIIHLKRKPMYYVVNIVMPCIFISTCGLFVFLLPPDHGEKVTLTVTVLLSSTFFLLFVADTMPPQSSVVPILSRYQTSMVILLVMSMHTSIFAFNLLY